MPTSLKRPQPAIRRKMFNIRLFGAIEIESNGEVLTSFRSLKALALLAYLISENRAVTRDYLAGLAWPESSQKQALGLLRRSLHSLTSQLPGCLEIDRRTVRWRADAPANVDIYQFERLTSSREDRRSRRRREPLSRPLSGGRLSGWLSRVRTLARQRTTTLASTCRADADVVDNLPHPSRQNTSGRWPMPGVCWRWNRGTRLRIERR